VARAVRALWAGDDRWPLLSSFRPEALQAAQAEAPEIPRGLLLDTDWAGWPEVADALDVRAVITHHRWMDAALVDRLHARERRALVYTVNEPAEATRLIDAGIDGLITDAVDRFAPAADRRSR
jgi:glycerophosphoryl diester phosphodiesterase